MKRLTPSVFFLVFLAGGGGGPSYAASSPSVPLPEEIRPGIVVVRVEALLHALLFTKGDEHRVDLRLQGGAIDRRRRDRDAARA
jgi:hypothetical protein